MSRRTRTFTPCSLDLSPQCLSGESIAARYGVGVDVERGRGPGVSKACRHNGDRHAGVEHFGGHEMTQVVKAEMTETGGLADADEAFGHEVGQPGAGSCCVGRE